MFMYGNLKIAMTHNTYIMKSIQYNKKFTSKYKNYGLQNSAHVHKKLNIDSNKI